jgi:RNA polymerase sigma-70 factor, ECF subfamily
MCAAVADLTDQTERYRKELVAYCYRMLGSGLEAEDAAQEALVRAWRGGEGFEGRSSLRSWLYRIATNVCIDMLRAPQRRALPMDLSGPSSVGPDANPGTPLEHSAWIEPIHDSRIVPESADPAQRAVLRESVRLALVAALQQLPPKQRAVLVLREVLDWSAAEVAELLDTTVDSVTSALARARSTMAGGPEPTGTRQLSDDDRALLDRYVAAFEAWDVTGLVALLHEDATLEMPPYQFWMRGRDDIERFWNGTGSICRNARVLATRANGGPATAVYHFAGDRRWAPFGIQLFEVRDGRIGGIGHFMNPALFGAFDLPPEITE